MKQSLIDLIRSNRISSVEVADALDKTGVINGLYPLNDLLFAAGRVQYVYTFNGSNWPLHEQIQNIKEDSIVFFDTIGCANRAVFGDIVSKYLMLYKKAKAIVVNGFLRDVHRLKKENYPIWLAGVTPKGCFNRRVEMTSDVEKYVQERFEQFNDTILVCDDSGVVHIDREHINQETFSKLEFVELQEDIWYYCIDTLKWSTYDTVCLKKYLDHSEELPQMMRRKLEKFMNRKS